MLVNLRLTKRQVGRRLVRESARTYQESRTDIFQTMAWDLYHLQLSHRILLRLDLSSAPYGQDPEIQVDMLPLLHHLQKEESWSR